MGAGLFILVVMQVVLPDLETRASIEVCGDDVRGDRPLSDEEFFDFCMKNPDLRIERYANGEIVIMPPAGMETGYRNNDIVSAARDLDEGDGRGVAFDSNTEFMLSEWRRIRTGCLMGSQEPLGITDQRRKEAFRKTVSGFHNRAEISERSAVYLEIQDGSVDRERRPIGMDDRARKAHGLRLSAWRARRRIVRCRFRRRRRAR